MQQTFGAVCALAVLGLLLIGPLYVAIAFHHEAPGNDFRCVTEMGCDPITLERPVAPEGNGRG